jgi:serine protease inhibitor
MNEWAKKNIKNNINKIINKLDDNINMILVIALYFDAFWNKKFLLKMTQNMDFLNYNDEKYIS